MIVGASYNDKAELRYLEPYFLSAEPSVLLQAMPTYLLPPGERLLVWKQSFLETALRRGMARVCAD